MDNSTRKKPADYAAKNIPAGYAAKNRSADYTTKNRSTDYTASNKPINQNTIENQHKQYLKKIKRRKKIRRRIISTIMMLLLVIIVVSSIALSPLCKITGIAVEGQSHYTTETYEKYAQGITGNNAFMAMGLNPASIFMLRYTNIESEIRKLPYVKDVKVKYQPFSKVKIQVTEREPLAIIAQNENKYILDIEGFVLEEYNKDVNSKEFFFIKGIDAQKDMAGKYIPDKNKENYRLAADTCDALLKYGKENNIPIKEKIDYIDVTDSKNIRIMISGLYSAELGNSDDMDYKLNYLFTIINEKLEGEKGTLKYDSKDKSFGFVPD